MATGRKRGRKHLEEKCHQTVFEFTEEEKNELSGSKEDLREDGAPPVDNLPKKRAAEDFEVGAGTCAVGNEVQSMLQRFGVDISKMMQTKKKRLEGLMKNYMQGSHHKLEQLWNSYHSQRQKLTQQHSQQVLLALQQWETEATRAAEQEEKLNNLFRQQQKILQQTQVVQRQKLKTIRELHEFFLKNKEDIEKSHESFLQATQLELRKELDTLQNKILMDTQQQEMATVRKSLQTMFF